MIRRRPHFRRSPRSIPPRTGSNGRSWISSASRLTGHPNPARVALHDDWPEGAWALRKDFAADSVVPRVAGDFHPFRPVTGEGVFQVPVGPVHAGIIEPGHFRFGVAGEPVLYLQLRLFYVHKGIEKRFEQLPWRHGLLLAESISGDTAVGHALAYAHAIERLANVTVPSRARALRVILLELERIYNHTADIGALATDVAFTVPASRAQALREGLVRMHDELFGTRLLRGTIALGGVKRDLLPQGRDVLRARLRAFEHEFDELITLLIDAGSFTDRVDGTGILTNQAARDLGIVGMAARASGIDADVRRDHPHDALREPAVRGARRRRRRCPSAAHGARAGGRAVPGHPAPGARCDRRNVRRAAHGAIARPAACAGSGAGVGGSVARAVHALGRDRRAGRTSHGSKSPTPAS